MEQKKAKWELMFNQACAFMDCASYIQVEREPIPMRTRSHNFVGVSLMALACEMWIKCLIAVNGRKYGKKHKLTDLWVVYKGIKPKEAISVEENIENLFGVKTDSKFNVWLSDASDAYVKWRYIFDYGDKDDMKVSPQFLRLFGYSLRNVCCIAVYGKPWGEYKS